MAVTSRSNWGGNETDSAYWNTKANITLRKDGIWNLGQTPQNMIFSNTMDFFSRGV